MLGPVFSQPARIGRLQSKMMCTNSKNVIAQLTELHDIRGQSPKLKHNFMNISVNFWHAGNIGGASK